MISNCQSPKQRHIKKPPSLPGRFNPLQGEMLSKLGSAANMIVSDIQQNLANAKVGRGDCRGDMAKSCESF